MLALGIDPGTATTGYGLVREMEGAPAVVTYGVILTPAGAPMAERLLAIYREIQRLIALHHPDTGAVEKLFFQRNVSTAMTVGQARGVALLAMAEAGLSIGEYNPRDVKLAVAGYGAADKPQMQGMVRAILNLPEAPRPDDAADALAVAICHLHSARLRALTDE
ncbi:MAG: crossover junction endodeoxyribonuclease RuvC [Anaerolineales bacterium]|nr:crossover junction endodeoxyribonuclease RuvC [Anaerolineales bacterium]